MSDSAMRRRIDSANNPRFRSARELRDRKGRSRQQRFLIDGIREIHRALEHGIAIVEAYVATELATSDEAIGLLQEFQARRLPQFELATSLWSRLAFGDRKEGILAVAEYPAPTQDSIDLGIDPFVLVLERIEKPGNVGAILRTADAVGVPCVLLVDGTADLLNPNAIRASVGAVFSVPVLQMTSPQARDWLSGRGLQVHVARPDAPTSYLDVDFRGPVAMVVGSEALGISSHWKQNEQLGFHVPMRGHGDSLNVSVTAAVVLYEAFRQRLS